MLSTGWRCAVGIVAVLMFCNAGSTLICRYVDRKLDEFECAIDLVMLGAALPVMVYPLLAFVFQRFGRRLRINEFSPTCIEAV